MKIAPEDDADMGVFFVDESGDEYPVTHKLSENTRKKLLFRVPTLAAGVYTLKIVTRFSNSGTLLNDPRIITYEFPLVVPHPVTEQPTE
jgi:hypothetical protein